ncbi:hypothetical protein BDV93DRAFT_605950 [Ceratobasidium sp. AG-I]|nr:hypothetical protein BDV93DRAFT_605950 [Ceratobasidium sp. AG-I]
MSDSDNDSEGSSTSFFDQRRLGRPFVMKSLLTEDTLEYHNTLEWPERDLFETASQEENTHDNFDEMYLAGVSYEDHLEGPREHSEQPLSDTGHIMRIIRATSLKELEVREVWWKKYLVDTERTIHELTMKTLEPGGETAENRTALTHATQVRDNLRFAITRARLVLAEVPPDLTNQKVPTDVSERVKSLVLHALKDCFEELQPDEKLLQVAQMGVDDMLQLGWPRDRIALIQQHKPLLQRLRVEASWKSEVSFRERAIEEAQQELQAQAHQQVQNTQQPPGQQQHHTQPLPRSILVGFSFTEQDVVQAKQMVHTIYRQFDGIREGLVDFPLPEDQSSQLYNKITAALPTVTKFTSVAWIHFLFFNNQRAITRAMRQCAMVQEQSCLLQLSPRRYVVPLNYISAAVNTLRAMMNEIGTVTRLRGTNLREFLVANVQGYPTTLPPPSAPQVTPTLMGPPAPQFAQLTQSLPSPPTHHFSQFPQFQATQAQASQVQISQFQAPQAPTPESLQQLQTRMFGVGPLDRTQG